MYPINNQLAQLGSRIRVIFVGYHYEIGYFDVKSITNIL